MEPINSIEEKLAHLVPPALSQDGQCRMENMIDELAGVDIAVDGKVDEMFYVNRRSWIWKAAAAIVVLAVPVVMIQREEDQPVEDASLAMVDDALVAGFSEDLSSPMILLKSIKLIDGRENDGLIVPGDGTAPHYRYRYRVIDEKLVRDPESGVEITLRQPRQEVVTIPVTQF